MATLFEVLVLQETRGRLADMLEIGHWLPGYRSQGSFLADGRAGGVVVVFSPSFSEVYPSVTMCEVVRGRIAIFRCRGGSNVVPIDIAAVHLVAIRGFLVSSQLLRLRERMSSCEEAHTIAMGDFNSAPADEGRLDVVTGATQFVDGRDDHMLHDVLERFGEVVPDGYSRRQFREGALSLVSRMDRVFRKVGTHVILDMRANAVFTLSLFDDRLPSDHAPLRLTLHPPRGPPRHGGPLPKWVPRHPMFTKVVSVEHLGLSGMRSFRPFGGLRGCSAPGCKAGHEVHPRTARGVPRRVDLSLADGGSPLACGTAWAASRVHPADP